MYMLDVVGIGPAGIDIFHTQNDVKRRLGGSIVNTVIALKKLGLETGFLGIVANDADGKVLLNELKKERINISRLRTDKFYCTPKCHIKISPTGKKIIKMDYYKRIDDFPKEDQRYLKSAKSLLVEAINPILKSYGHFAEKYQKNLFISLHNIEPGIKLEFKGFGIGTIFSNESEFKRIEDKVDFLTKNNTKIIVTKGARGCTIYTKSGIKNYPAFDVEVVDTTGAGDAFAAGFIFGELKGWDLNRKCEFATAMGALTTQHYGARSKTYSPKEVKRFINNFQKKSKI